MAVYYYGVESFKKVFGPKGEVKQCSFCHQSYQETYVKFNKWGHLDYIPLIYLGADYYHFCPVCFNGDKFVKEGKKEAKRIVKDKTPATTNLVPRGIHHASSKTYDLILEDKNSGQTFPIGTNMKKSDYKALKKSRFYKKIEEVEM
ncbi:MAG: hypothetical protein IKG93_11970 [Clostridiales bacterium]|jgi:hypothetical protein|nr:hypothetical protein [Clostridiales bacterium]